ncbi:chemotaxis protein CheW [Leeia oryzae]|uniref:chemotaxis protein CheW n=1 Tax=Leeia oryzae TaxID=356662 RepID=UPI0003624694|nr:chemotaxis protein CheW [Leeia oryzae]
MSSLVKAEQGTSVAVPQDESQYLTFILGGEMFAIGILNIKEIIEYGHLTEVPMMPAFIRGVINLRGRVVPVIDLRSRFGKPSTEVTKRTCIVIIEVQVAGGAEDEGTTQDIGVVVDSVSEVLEIATQDIEPPPAFGAHIRTDFIQGMGKVNGQFVIILSVENVLSVEEMAALGQGMDVATA